MYNPDDPFDGYTPGGIPDEARRPPSTIWHCAGPWTEAEIAPRAWIAPGYLLRGSVTVIGGAGSAGKSTIAVAYSVALALGEPCQRFKPAEPCRVMTYNVEDDDDEQKRRFSAYLRTINRTPDDIIHNLYMCGPDEVGSLLTRDKQNGEVYFTEAMENLAAAVEVFRPDVLFLDPLIELHDCEENDNTALRSIMARFRQLAKQYRMSVVLLHHTRKGSTAQAGDPDSLRGASSILGSARIVLTCVPMTSDEATELGVADRQRGYFFRMDGAKSNYAGLQSAEWFERSIITLDNGDTVAAAVEWSPPVNTAGKVGTDSRQAIEADIAAGSMYGPWSIRLSSDARSIRNLLDRHGVTTPQGQRKIIDELLHSGFQVATFRQPDTRYKLPGLQCADGRPRNVDWIKPITTA